LEHSPISARSLRRAASMWLDQSSSRRLLQAGRILIAPRQFVLRRRTARAWLRRCDPPLRLDRQAGYASFTPESLPGSMRMLAACGRVVGELRPYLERIHAASSGKFHLTADLFSDELHAREPEFVDFALQDEVLLPVIEYLGTLPYLARLALPHSVHLAGLDGPAYHQRFHVDNDDFRQVKLFVNVGEVGPDEGPLSFLPADVSARVLRALRREGRVVARTTTFSDEEVFRHCDRASLVQLTGPPGTGVFLDPSRCLHCGSRVGSGRERVMLAAAYLRYHRPLENASSQLDATRPGLDPVRRLVLESPRPRPRGYFCPDPVRMLAGRESVQGAR
jgi:hypothetical protein